ncbi:pituitary tumor-transforming gene 1 protein-interacting protein-like [Rhopilema esculentum]|uniref:pituitary tumor-transforming gene 1 protein-interacting protein-like n=1 Tax=Rhopilema esculentum TaxID=499914 RepID=UPI0031D51128|eukprot:gene6474-11929_t
MASVYLLMLIFSTLGFLEVAYSGHLLQDLGGNETLNTSTTEHPTTTNATTKLPTTKLPSTTTRVTPTSSKNATSTAGPKKDCSKHTSCDSCADSYKCYWCAPSKSCEKWPEHKITPGSCSGNKWYWKQCTIPGYILVIVVPVLGVLILLTCGCCIYCKCCRVKSKNKERERIERRREDMKDKHEERKRERQSRTDLIRQKYGLLKTEDEEPLL